MQHLEHLSVLSCPSKKGRFLETRTTKQNCRFPRVLFQPNIEAFTDRYCVTTAITFTVHPINTLHETLQIRCTLQLYLSTFIMETLQETLQQLICIVNSFGIFAHYPDHGSSGIWLIQGIQVLTQSGNDAFIPGLSKCRWITGVNWTCLTPFLPTSFCRESCTEFMFGISTQQAAFSSNYRRYSQAFFFFPKLSTEISQGLCSLIHQQDHPDVEFKIKLPPFLFANGNV